MATDILLDGPEGRHRLDHSAGKGRAIAGMQVEELAPRMGPTPGQVRGIIGATILAEPIVGGIAIDLQ